MNREQVEAFVAELKGLAEARLPGDGIFICVVATREANGLVCGSSLGPVELQRAFVALGQAEPVRIDFGGEL